VHVEISKMMVAEDVTITEEVLVEVWWRKVQLKKKGFAPREGSGG
jgi:hypothetical protein